MEDPQTDKIARQAWYRRPEYVLIAFIAMFYIALIGRYRAFDLDTVWYLSYSHTFWTRH